MVLADILNQKILLFIFQLMKYTYDVRDSMIFMKFAHELVA